MSGWDRQQAGAQAARTGGPGGPESLTFDYQVGYAEEQRRRSQAAHDQARMLAIAADVASPSGMPRASRPAASASVGQRPAGNGAATLVTVELVAILVFGGLSVHQELAGVPGWLLAVGGVGLLVLLIGLFARSTLGYWVITLGLTAVWMLVGAALGQDALGPLGMVLGGIIGLGLGLGVHKSARTTLRER